jgi:hypothetical protein
VSAGCPHERVVGRGQNHGESRRGYCLPARELPKDSPRSRERGQLDLQSSAENIQRRLRTNEDQHTATSGASRGFTGRERRERPVFFAHVFAASGSRSDPER